MKSVGYILIGFSVLLFVFLGYDQYRGVTKEFRMPVMIRRQVDPGKFHDEMMGKCTLTTLFLLVGIVFCTLERVTEREDPMSTDFEEDEATDDEGEPAKGTNSEENPRR